MRNIEVKTMVNIALFAVIIAICAWITVPMTVPFTMQLFGVFLALMMLGGRNGTAAILLYILLGLVGVPVFAGFSAGPAALFGPTGGYIMGFLAIGLISIGISAVTKKDAPAWTYLIGLAVCYILGTLWFCYIMGTQGNTYGFVEALLICVVPYIIPDVVKLVLADLLGVRLRKIIGVRAI